MLRKLLQMFGMSRSKSDQALTGLEQLLDRVEPVNTIQGLLVATQAVALSPPLLPGAAVCLDTNVFFRLANLPERAQVIDYLASQHKEPLIVSAQALQEVWNNYLNGIETVAGDIRSKLEALTKSVLPLETEFQSFKDRFDAVLTEFKGEYGHLHKEGMKERVRSLIEILENKAVFSEVPRARFERFYSVRKTTKTPPGFRDDGAGDYFVWLDFLYGLRMERESGSKFDRAVLITDDKKVDWVRGGVAHPTLTAECLSYVGVPLEIWSLRRLVEATADA